MSPAAWSFPRPADDADDLVAVGADLAPETLLGAYAGGYFPMFVPVGGRTDGDALGWFSPRRRGVLVPRRLVVSRSLLRSVRRFRFSVDSAFEEVVAGCGDPSRPGAWITPHIAGAYGELHRLGTAHSVEVWADDRLVGGLYGVAPGRLFAAESKFRRATDASKAAVVGLVALVQADADLQPEPEPLIDTQWATEHLATLGIEEWPRERYLASLDALVAAPGPDFERWSVDGLGFTELVHSRARDARRGPR
ncbi:MAG: leucyl/phenylalanyl-tRNA--protein transferase [Microthrixaceae bacterium]